MYNIVQSIYLNDTVSENLIFNGAKFLIPEGVSSAFQIEIIHAAQQLVWQMNKYAISMRSLILRHDEMQLKLREISFVFKQESDLSFPFGQYMGNVIFIFFSDKHINFLLDEDIYFHEYSHSISHQILFFAELNPTRYAFLDEALADFFTLLTSGRKSIGTLSNYMLRDYQNEGNLIKEIHEIENCIYQEGMLYCKLWLVVWELFQKRDYNLAVFLESIVHSLKKFKTFEEKNLNGKAVNRFNNYYLELNKNLKELCQMNLEKHEGIKTLLNVLPS